MRQSGSLCEEPRGCWPQLWYWGFPSISMILDEALVLDTVIYGCAAILNGLPTLLRGPAMLIANTVVNVFIISGSGQAAAVMPVFIPVADLVG
ncbi:MAG: hypothetical protein EP146_18810 [Oscillibacter sp.]|nr:hypothetical protein [Oscillibacter sp.]